MAEKESQTHAFGIAAFVLFVVFIIILNILPFPSDYGFWPLAGITAVTCIVGYVIYMLAIEIVQNIYKIIVEIAAAILLFFNVTCGAACWAYFEQIKLFLLQLEILIKWNQTFVAISVLVLIMLILNLFAIWILYPMSKIAGTRLDPE